MIPLLLACSSTTLSGDSGEIPTTADSAAEQLPADTAAPPPTPAPTAPVLIDVTCPSPIPDESAIPCDVRLSWPDGTEEAAGIAGFSQRGRSSLGFPKHQYKVEFIDSDGASAPVSLFGLGRESDWVLNGMWIDRAMIRNKLAWDLFNALASPPDHAPESVYAELTLDGSYLGVFLLNQTIDRDASRLDFAADDGTGSRFIVAADESGIASTVQYGSWKVEYPGPTEQTRSVLDGITTHLASWEARINAGEDPFTQMDLDSFVRFVLIEEFMKNNDGYYLSHRLWRGDDGKLRMVPWDLDLTLGQPNYNENWRSDLWIAYRPLIVSGSETSKFNERFLEMWTEARAGPLATEAVIARIAAQRATMGDAVDRNWATWDITTVDFGGELYAVSSPEEEYARVDTWVRARLEWMDANVAAY